METPDLRSGTGDFRAQPITTKDFLASKKGLVEKKPKIVHEPLKSYKRIPTDENDFHDGLGEIIERDFFPQLAEAKGKTFDDSEAKKLGLNEYLEIYYNENRCDIPNIEYKEEFKTRLSLQAGVPEQKQALIAASQDPLALALPSSTLTLNLETRPESNEDILRHADNKPKINYENTALKTDPFSSVTDEAKPKASVIAVRDSRSETFKFVGYNQQPQHFVSMTPSPNPDSVGSPIMTYGFLERTPAKIASTPKTSGFSIKPVSAREEIAHKLERIATSRAKATPSPLSRSKLLRDYRRGTTPTSPWVSQQFQNIRSGRMRSSSKTPTPTRRVVPIVRLHGEKSKKFSNETVGKIIDVEPGKDLTDNLLQLPKIAKGL